MRKASIAAGFANGLFELAAARGADKVKLAARAGVLPEALANPDDRIPYEVYKALMRAAKSLTRDPALALRFGETYSMADLSIVGLIGQSCATAAEAFAELDRFTRLIADIEVDHPEGRRLVIERAQGEVWLVDTRKDPNEFPEMTESGFARIAASSRANPGPSLIREIHVTHAAPDYRAEYDRAFGLPIVFESDRNALLMRDASFLDYKFPAPSRYVFGVLSERAEALLKRLEGSQSTRGRVESLLIPLLHTGEANIDAIAARVGLSRQTLYRRLKSEGATFEEVLDELRRRLALDYVEGGEVSLNEIAYLVGFSDPAAFSRAFKRWTGSAPRDWRRQR